MISRHIGCQQIRVLQSALHGEKHRVLSGRAHEFSHEIFRLCGFYRHTDKIIGAKIPGKDICGDPGRLNRFILHLDGHALPADRLQDRFIAIVYGNLCSPLGENSGQCTSQTAGADNCNFHNSFPLLSHCMQIIVNPINISILCFFPLGKKKDSGPRLGSRIITLLKKAIKNLPQHPAEAGLIQIAL